MWKTLLASLNSPHKVWAYNKRRKGQTHIRKLVRGSAYRLVVHQNNEQTSDKNKEEEGFPLIQMNIEVIPRPDQG